MQNRNSFKEMNSLFIISCWKQDQTLFEHKQITDTTETEKK